MDYSVRSVSPLFLCFPLDGVSRHSSSYLLVSPRDRPLPSGQTSPMPTLWSRIGRRDVLPLMSMGYVVPVHISMLTNCNCFIGGNTLQSYVNSRITIHRSTSRQCYLQTVFKVVANPWD